MSDIPLANEILSAGEPPPEDIAKFFAFTARAIARLINENAAQLRDGLPIRFVFPVVRDMGRYRKLWDEHYGKFSDLLGAKGYIVGIEKFGERFGNTFEISLSSNQLKKPFPIQAADDLKPGESTT